jgi:TolB-like protein
VLDVKNIRFVTLSFLLSSILYSQDFRQTVAVIDFDASGISQLEATSLTNRFRTAVGDVGAMRLVERGMMEEVLQEQGFQQTGCTSEECAVEVGQLLGVQNMIGGSIGRVGETFTLDVRMISVQSGISLKTKQQTYAGEIDDLIIEIEVLAYELYDATIPDELEARRIAGVVVKDLYGTSVVLDGDKVRVAESGGVPVAQGIPQKTRMGAVVRSMAVPGLGQFYSGNRLFGTGFLVGELAVAGLFYTTYTAYQTATDDYNGFQALYDLEENPNNAAEHRANILQSLDAIESNKAMMDQLASAAMGIWAINVVHAFILKPDNSTAHKEPLIKLAYDPTTRSHQLRFTIDLD